MNAWGLIIEQFQKLPSNVSYKPIENNITTKTCNRCNRELSLDKFYLRQRANQKYYPFNPCIECTRKLNSEKSKKRKTNANQSTATG